MEEKELICEYCKVPIKENDHKCPNCGADCTKTIREYKKHKSIEAAERSKKIQRDMDRSFRIPLIIFLTFFILFFGFILYSAFRQASNIKNDDTKVTVKYNEEAKTKDISVILDSYEMYEHKTDKFPNDMDDNTKPGYQKIAFHFVIKNNTEEVFDTRFDSNVSLTADDYKVDEADLEKCYTCYTVSGKDSYQDLNDQIAAGEKLQGYAGFLVPKDKKILKFKVGNNIIITMDNPAYQQ